MSVAMEKETRRKMSNEQPPKKFMSREINGENGQRQKLSGEREGKQAR